MFTLKVENFKNEILNLSSDKRYSIIKVEGLNPPSATINTASITTSDGAFFNSSRIESRNLVLTIVLRKDIETSRINLYRFFRPKIKCKIYYKNGTRDVYIEGYVDKFEDDFFTQTQKVQISLMCYQPFFKAVHDLVVDLSVVLKEFEFPFDIENLGQEFSTIERTYECVLKNEGEVDNGLIIELRATGSVENPVIYNADTREFIGLNYTVLEGDLITINTNVGEKSVTLLRNGIKSNIINYIKKDSTWLKAYSGDNVYTYICDNNTEDLLSIKFIHTHQYLGV